MAPSNGKSIGPCTITVSIIPIKARPGLRRGAAALALTAAAAGLAEDGGIETRYATSRAGTLASLGKQRFLTGYCETGDLPPNRQPVLVAVTVQLPSASRQ